MQANFRLERGASVGLALFTAGSLYAGYLVWRWGASGFTDLPFVPANMVAFTAIVLGVEVIFTSFYLSAIAE